MSIFNLDDITKNSDVARSRFIVETLANKITDQAKLAAELGLYEIKINYLKEEIREFDEEIKKLEIEVAKLQGDDRLRWNDKLQKLHSKRAELINETKNSILTFSKNNELWIKDISQNIN